MKKSKRNDPDGISTKELKQAVEHVIQQLGQPAREYKDRVFRMLFKEKRHALELYNALNHTDYDDPEELTITTLENALYMGMKNDVSFVLALQLVLYEHQSTWNPNLPLRDLFYVTGMLASLTQKANLYGRTLIQLPEPRFIVFYNGQETKPDMTELRLSHAYEVQSGEPMLELVVKVLNINKGHNEELAKKSPTLYQYMQFVDLVREKQKTMDFSEAMEAAITECIRRGILKEFLIKNRSEVLRMTIFEYDQEKHLQQEREESEMIGEERGIRIGEARGEIRGREVQARSMSLELYRNGVPLETIARAAQVSIEVVQQWIKTE